MTAWYSCEAQRARSLHRVAVCEMARKDARRADDLRAAGQDERAAVFEQEFRGLCERWGFDRAAVAPWRRLADVLERERSMDQLDDFVKR